MRVNYVPIIFSCSFLNWACSFSLLGGGGLFHTMNNDYYVLLLFCWTGRTCLKVLKQCLLFFSFGESALCSSLTSIFIIRNCFLSQNYLHIWYISTHVENVYNPPSPPTSTRIMDFVKVIMWVDNLRKKKMLLHYQIDQGANRSQTLLSEKRHLAKSFRAVVIQHTGVLHVWIPLTLFEL